MTIADTTPTAAPVAPPAPSPEVPAAEYHPSQDDAAGLATYREVKAAGAEQPPPVDPDVPNPISVPGTSDAGAKPAAAPPADTSEDAKLAKIFNRISRLEDERNQATAAVQARDAELAKLKERAAYADQYEKDLSEFREDPERFFTKIKWDRQTIEDYIANGPRKVDTAVAATERRTQELEARLAKFEKAEAERELAGRREQYKAALPNQLTGREDQYPHLFAFYDKPAELADALFGVMSEAYRTQNREMSADETAAVLESTLASHAERLNRTRSKSPAGTQSPNPPAPVGTKPLPTPTLTNTSPAATRTPTTDSDNDDDLLEIAKQTLRKGRAA
jgi:hypothetical protein